MIRIRQILQEVQTKNIEQDKTIAALLQHLDNLENVINH